MNFNAGAQSRDLRPISQINNTRKIAQDPHNISDDETKRQSVGLGERQISKITLDDLQDLRVDRLSTNFVPQKATQTCKASWYIKPMVKAIPYRVRDEWVVSEDTKEDFNLTQ